MQVEVNYLAISLAAASSMVVGAIWYTPAVFGKQWQKLANVNPEKRMKQMNASQIAVMYISTFVASLLTAFILAHVAYFSNHFFKDSFLQDSLTTGVWIWLGFTAARIFVHDTFEDRSRKLTLLTVGHEFVTIMVMALIIGAWGIK
mgnify:CR=1 FL=1